MNDKDTALEARLVRAGRSLAYPATPAIADRVAQRLSSHSTSHSRPLRQVAITLTAIILIVVGLLAVPPVRASILEFLQLGSVRIWLVEPTVTPTVIPTVTLASAVGADRIPRPALTPRPTETAISSLGSLAGETTLDDAQTRSAFPIRLPTYPADLGEPDRVYKQDVPATTIVLVWLDEAEEVRMSLHILTEGAVAYKMQPLSLEETMVHGQRALWTTGPYWLQVGQSSLASFRLIDGHTLIWTEGTLTYRLETNLSMEEAVRVAESLK